MRKCFADVYICFRKTIIKSKDVYLFTQILIIEKYQVYKHDFFFFVSLWRMEWHPLPAC